mmetsp:Transcript_63822/g.134418  ORF Transcript_63822/g.134418 Transcript_63822/m.134418 type:complete len:476 (-) Transcript_63822:261-1688(-)|eukprot:CAMPEP_0206456732 /NCGR_PEP_ID=MMETSP0324_2-20121206/22545_1 /ASSEMBLY_ACC=CAM_ASM_000836 /TAXON_ID=2866 /ORGANISM="Crypthecodinium cohnii, Strain Seligo" /LENGTH=475 /DNA_ID=CAMNT_0053927727 /DNA_START=267 /DNA_END=1694 /DNA_ORIENTATION=-
MQLSATAVLALLASLATSPGASATSVGVGSEAGSGSASGSQSSATASEYEEFRRKFRGESEDQVSFEKRLGIFEKRKAAVEAHNARSDKLWVATLNKFADYTDEEWSALLGYKRHDSWVPPGGGDGDGPRTGSFLEVRGKTQVGVVLESIDWRHHLSKSLSTEFIREQGSCGSCWAVAAAGSLETLAERSGLKVEPLSYEQLVDCTPNPKHCGGDGGCKGATGELAFTQAARSGVVPASMYQGYQHDGDGQCKTSANQVKSFKIQGFQRLPTNKLHDMLRALSSTGPAVVSVDASSWSSYLSGVFNDCAKDATVNHAVLAVGYGYDANLNEKYWLIRNSWGPAWGEAGFIRLQRHDSDKGDAGHCGTDYSPLEGVGCAGGPKQIPVCGMCGVLSDTSYPYGMSEVVNGKQSGPSSLGEENEEDEQDQDEAADDVADDDQAPSSSNSKSFLDLGLKNQRRSDETDDLDAEEGRQSL